MPLTSNPAGAGTNVAGRRSFALAGLRVTFPGVLTLVTTLLIAVASFTSEANLLLLLFGIACGLLGFNLVCCLRTVRRIDVERVITGTAVAGRPTRIAYTIRNRRRWTRAWAVTISELPRTRHDSGLGQVFVPVLAANEERRIETVVTCAKRGRIQLSGIRISCGFPFGLFRCRCDVEARAELLVYPAVGRVRREFWHKHVLAESSNARRVPHRTDDNEFHGVREYRQGDNPRWIHWRRSAHAGQLVVRESQPIRDSELICLLDPWPGEIPGERNPAGSRRSRGSSPSGTERACDEAVEKVISAAATAVCEALDRGYRVGLVCRAAVPVMVAPAGGRAQRLRVLRELALLAPGAAAPLDELIRGIRWPGHWNSHCLVFTTVTDDAHARVLRMLGGRTESLMLVSPQSGWLDKLVDLAGAAKDPRSVRP